MAGNLVKRVMLKIVADDGDSEEKLDRISEKADELARKHPDIKVRIDSAAASAKLAVLKGEMRAAADEANKDNGGGFMSGLRGLVPAIGEMSMFQKVMLGVNLATTFAEPLIAGVTVAVGGMASGLVAAGAGVGVFGLVAKGVYSQVSSQIQNYNADMLAAQEATSKTAKAQDELKAKDAFNGLSASQKEFAQGIVTIQGDWQHFVTENTAGVASIMHQGMGLLPGLFKDLQGFLPGTEAAIHHIISDLGTGLKSSSFQSFIHMLQDNAGPALEKTAGIIGHLFVGIGGIIKAFMPEAQSMLGGLDSGMARFAHWGQTLSSHSGFQSLMTMFRTETPMAVHTLANLGSMLKTLLSDITGLDGVGNSKTLLEIAEPFTTLLKVLLKVNPDLVRVGLYMLAAYSGGKKLVTVFGGLKTGVTTVKDLASGVQNFTAGFGNAEKAADDATGAWGTWGGKVSSVFTSAKGMVTGWLQKLGLMTAATEDATAATEGEAGAQEGLDVAMDANPIGLIIAAIGLLVVGFVELWKHSAAFRNFWIGLWHDIEHLVSDAVSFIEGHWKLIVDILTGPVGMAIEWIVGHWHDVLSVFDDAIQWVESHWKLILGILTGPIGLATVFIIDHWHQIVSGAENMVHDVISFFEQLPGRILHALGDVSHLLWNVGRDLLEGLGNGVISMVGWLESKITGIGSDVVGWFKSALGIGSPSKYTFYHGQMLAQGLIDGMNSMNGGATAAATRLASAVLSGATGGAHSAAAAAAGGGVTVEIHPPPNMTSLDPGFWVALGKGIRIRGGDPRILTHKVQLT
jgi:phage-related protein